MRCNAEDPEIAGVVLGELGRLRGRVAADRQREPDAPGRAARRSARR